MTKPKDVDQKTAEVVDNDTDPKAVYVDGKKPDTGTVSKEAAEKGAEYGTRGTPKVEADGDHEGTGDETDVKQRDSGRRTDGGHRTGKQPAADLPPAGDILWAAEGDTAVEIDLDKK